MKPYQEIRPLTPEEVRGVWSLPLSDVVQRARKCTDHLFGPRVFLRGLIEVTNYCVQNCLYCGIRRGNGKVDRYRLDEENVLSIVRKGFQRGFRTFVLQGGEDPEYSSRRLARLCERIRNTIGEDAAVTISFGILPLQGYRDLAKAGANRYLLRFETSDPILHQYLRNGIPLSRRLQALEDIRATGLEVGSGFMVGLPGETEETRIQNILLAQTLELDMGGIGPFIPHPHTPLAAAPQQPLELSVRSTALLRLVLPGCNIPATTAAGSLHPKGRERMLEAGANVLMPNLTPPLYKKAYELYPGKICVEESGFACVSCLEGRVRGLGLELSWERGDSLQIQNRRMNGCVRN
ncbi:MAG: [FeFe] hydrogenase H-cluster radical SAM maturase HydE [Spirochaetes bacterium]|nr:[FeFe] hydrogenase H-cluster radical SAM maturase HydE [Spirochaetota bacterium]